MRRLSLWLPPIAYMVLIFYVSGQSDPFPTITPYFWDKAVHFSEYGVLGIFFCRAIRGEQVGWPLALTLALVATAAYGASDEWHQAYVAMRSSDIHDWFADTLGAALGLTLYRTWNLVIW